MRKVRSCATNVEGAYHDWFLCLSPLLASEDYYILENLKTAYKTEYVELRYDYDKQLLTQTGMNDIII